MTSKNFPCSPPEQLLVSAKESIINSSSHGDHPTISTLSLPLVYRVLLMLANKNIFYNIILYSISLSNQFLIILGTSRNVEHNKDGLFIEQSVTRVQLTSEILVTLTLRAFWNAIPTLFQHSMMHFIWTYVSMYQRSVYVHSWINTSNKTHMRCMYACMSVCI